MMDWKCKSFDQLCTDELYSLLQLRSEVFVVEQHCFYQDMDDKDKKAFHLLGWKDDVLIAYSRLLPPGISYKEPSIGRVVLKLNSRAQGLGKTLMLESIRKVHELFGPQPIKISAQYHLMQFYINLGFEPCSEVYDDAGIDHIEMITQ